jgi:hypothetical protein
VFEPGGEAMRIIVRAAVLSVAAAWVACSTTKVTSSWKSPAAATAQVDRMLVVALVPEETVRRNLEEKLASELRKKGAEASPSAQFVQEGSSLTREKVNEVVQGNHFDSVLIAQYTGTERSLEYVPGTYDDYFFYRSPTVYRRGHVVERKEVKLESLLFDAKNGGRLLWSATTSTVDPDSGEKAIPHVAEKIANELEKHVSI